MTKRPLNQRRIRWPGPKSRSQLERMSTEQSLRLALRLHVCWAESHRRDMEWDLYWANVYRRLLGRKEKP